MSLVLAAVLVACSEGRAVRGGFVGTRGSQFIVNGRPFYFNGFNSYWLMYMASDPSTRVKVSDTFAQAAKYGMNVARTWAFSDGGYRALQTAPGSGFCGVRSEETWDLSNFEFGEQLGRFWREKQYVQWARERGQYLNNEDEFFTNSIVKGYYKNHIKAVLNRVNTITGVAYKDDPTIFAWELMNEPRCQSDLSGKPIQEWVAEMSAYLKSMDKNHLLEIGMEGFYGESMPEKKQNNPGYEVGTDLLPIIVFLMSTSPQFIFTLINGTVSGSNDEAQDAFVEKWIQAHIDDSKSILRKWECEVYGCARRRGPCGGALFWQVMAEGMENWSDGYEVVLEQSPTTVGVIDQQSRRISSLNQ
ncbi:UNVERIFIED_CONTAM: Mannan endo-1,4-beta-mannosidase 4 [Sesamum calycinum]|uniref:mannan endo-1,4-beta-mannosidase n=1 Tax=Sesamum calycinum TaxID=2727403 RepID=A0AAW2SW34_9LAMI